MLKPKSKHKLKPISIRTILPGDTLHLQVPQNRFLSAGLYAVSVDRELSRSKRGQWFHCSFPLTEAFDFCIHFKLAILKHDSLNGYAFLGDDQFPVTYVHEANIERRLKMSYDYLLQSQQRFDDD